MFIQAFTGLALLKFNVPLVNMSISQLIIGWNLGALVGSAALALWIVRMVHYVLNWAFILMTTIHLYLAATVDVPCALDFFGMEELQVHPGGHGHKETPADAAAIAPSATPELQTIS
jgi:hypothetical protein